ncbi:MAG TPA: spore coat protein [Candidatus Acidoferrum sp.]|nr:spore coat protein [Candidatus Acidoferrum sp.]
MSLTQKETTLLKDLKNQEKLCIEKYAKYSSEANDGQLKNLFMQIGQVERGHFETLGKIETGATASTAGSGGSGSSQQSPPTFEKSTCTAQEQKDDAFLCNDLLAMEKHVSSSYDTCIFEFTCPETRNTLNHIQKEEQQHGKMLYDYMSTNGMYG